MANSRDPRKPTRFHRGSKRYGDVGGHSPPDDTLENTRDHERIWFELKRSRSCCDCTSPGFKYCFDTFDYPNYICEGQFVGGDSLAGYWPGKGGLYGLGGWQVYAGCSFGESDNLFSELQNSTVDFFNNGSWRNGPFWRKNYFGNNLVVILGWQNLFPAVDWTFEAWVRPEASQIASGATISTCGSFSGLSTGGFFTYYGTDGGIGFQHAEIAGGATQFSGPGWFEADQWHHLAIRRDTVGQTIAFFINGRLAISRILPTSGWGVTPGLAGEFSLDRGDWSDLAYYTSALAPSVIRRHYQAVYGVEGAANPLESTEGNIEDPTTVITEQIVIDQISGGGVPGSIAVSQGDFTAFVSPEDTPFELEARKGQPDGYASLGAAALVPEDELGTGGGTKDKFLRGDQVWKEGILTPRPIRREQLLTSTPDVSDEFLEHQLAISGLVGYWKLTEASAPFDDLYSGNNLSATGTPTAESGDFPLFKDETSLTLDSGDGAHGYSNGVDKDSFGMSGWVWVDAYPASTKNLYAYGDEFNNSGYTGLAVRSDGKLTILRGGVEFGVSPDVLPTGRWVHTSFLFRASGGSPIREITVDGEIVLSETTGGYGSVTLFTGGVKFGDTGIACRIGHVALYTNATGASVYVGPYPYRTWVWKSVDQADLSLGGGVSGIDASEDDTPVTAAPRPRFNFKSGTNVTVTVTDDSVDDEVEVEIAASPPAGAGLDVRDNDADVTASPRGHVNFLDGTGTTVVTTDDGANDEVEVQVDVDNPLPDPSGETDGKVLTIATGAAVWDDAPSGIPDPSGEVDGQVLTVDTGVAVWADPPAGGGGGGAGGLFDAYAYLRDEKSSGTQGGTVTTGSYVKRTLNTEVEDAEGMVSLASDQFTLDAGTYLIKARAPFYSVARSRLRLYNATDAAAVKYGATQYSPSSGDPTQSEPVLTCCVTIASAKAFELQYKVAGAGGGANTLGVANSDSSVNEVYAEVEIWRFGDGAGGGGGDSYAVEPAMAPPASAHAMDDEFDAATLDAKWSWRNAGGSPVATLTDGGLIASQSGGAVASLKQAASFAGDFTITTRLDILGGIHGLMVGVAGGNSIIFGYDGGTYRIWRLTSGGGWSSTVVDGSAIPARYLRIRMVSSVLRFELSQDGRVFVETSTGHRQTVGGGQHLTSVGEVGLGIGAGPEFSYEFFRVTEP